MVLYLGVIGITTLLGWLCQHVKKKQKKILFIFMVLVPTLISGLRGVGTDYFLYQIRYESLISNVTILRDGTTLTGPFYLYFEFFEKIGLGYQAAIFIVSLLTIGIAFYIIFDLEDQVNTTFAVFSFMSMYYLLSFNLFRQVLAGEMFVLSVHLYSKTRNKKSFWIPMLIGCLIHSSVILYGFFYLVFPFVKNKKRGKQSVYFILFVFVFSMPLIARFLSNFATYLPHYAYYFLHFGYMGIGLGILRYVFLVWLPILYFCYGKSTRLCSNMWQEYIFVAIIGSILCLSSYVSDTFLYRIGYTGLFVMPLLHGVMIKNFKRNKQLMAIGLGLFLLLFFYYDFIYLNSGEVFPYEFFW